MKVSVRVHSPDSNGVVHHIHMKSVSIYSQVRGNIDIPNDMKVSVGGHRPDSNRVVHHIYMKSVSIYSQVRWDIHVPNDVEVSLGGRRLNSDPVCRRVHMKRIFIHCEVTTDTCVSGDDQNIRTVYIHIEVGSHVQSVDGARVHDPYVGLGENATIHVYIQCLRGEWGDGFTTRTRFCVRQSEFTRTLQKPNRDVRTWAVHDDSEVEGRISDHIVSPQFYYGIRDSEVFGVNHGKDTIDLCVPLDDDISINFRTSVHDENIRTGVTNI